MTPPSTNIPTQLHDACDADDAHDAHDPPPRALNWRGVLLIGVGLSCLLPGVSPAIALALGAAVALTIGNALPRHTQRLAKVLLPACIVLLGFGMDLRTLLGAGATGAVLAGASIALTLVLGTWLGKRLRVGATTSVLISSGTAICGGSAIAAVAAAVGAAPGPVSVALATVFVLNAVALYLFPVIGHALDLTQLQFGTWAGIAIHDVSSVVGAATGFGHDALQHATAVKLFRSLWIIPIALLLSRHFHDPAAAVPVTDHPTAPVDASNDRVRPGLPWFIVLFVLASVSRSLFPAIESVAPTLRTLAITGLTVALFLIGTSLSRPTLKAVGLRPMLQGATLWLIVSALTLAVVIMQG